VGKWVVVAGLAVLALSLWAVFHFVPLSMGRDSESVAPVGVAEASPEQVQQFCGYCHQVPTPDLFARDAWPHEVRQGFEFHRTLGRTDIAAPSYESVINYYQNRAPTKLDLRPAEPFSPPPSVLMEPSHFRVPDDQTQPAISNVNLVHLFHPDKLDVLVCDMREGWITAFQPYANPPCNRVLGKASNPAHAEVVELEGNGIKDIIVADLGNFAPTDWKVGKVVLLKGSRDGKFTPFTLLENVGRVADVQAADFNGDGKIDLIVAVFGWRATGEIIYLENQTTDWSKPKFVPHVVDKRHGAIHVPVADLNGDGKMDFVALISQEHETIVAFLNDGKGNFRPETIYTAPHPAYGSTGIQLVDLNNDGKLDVLYTNGDVMDSGALRPDHGVQWLENKGTFPFEHHHLLSMYGVQRAVAADLRHVGLKDIVAVNCLPEEIYGKQLLWSLNLDSIVVLEQTAPGQFTRHTLEKGNCNHVTCSLGSLENDGKIDLVTGDFYFRPKAKDITDSVTVWKNRGKK
jgi:hypothetical protein